MSTTILSGDFTVYFSNDTGGDKQIKWTGSATGTRTVSELYSSIQDLFDNDSAGEGLYMDEGIPMSAQTPTQYTIGRIETNDTEPWYIDPVSVQHLTGGGLTTTGWARIQDTQPGIVHVERTGTNIVAGDVGYAINNSTDTGTLLDIDPDGDLVIRPTDDSSTHNWDTGSGDIVCNGHTDQQTAAATTGNEIYANIYTLGSIVSGTNLCVVQDGICIEYWWGSGHIDVLMPVQHHGEVIDSGVLTIYARQYSKLYDHFQVAITDGSRTPIPLATSNDVNNATGLRQLTGSSGVSDFDVNNFIYAPAAGGWSAATKKGVVTAVGGSISAPVIDYYLIGDITSDFVDTDTVKEYDPVASGDGDGSCTVNGDPINTGISSLTGITYTFGATSQDIGNGNGSRPYNVLINCGGNSLSDFYEHTKYVTRRGYLTTLNGKAGEQYLGTGEIYLYMQSNGGFTEGDKITGGTSEATGYIVANHTYNPYYLTVRDVRGTFDNAETVTDEHTGSATTTASNAVETITLSKVAPFGTFAGGNFFGTRGVWITNMAGSDSNNYQLTDSENEPQSPPATVAVQVLQVEVGDRVSVFRTTGDNETINKTYLVSDSSANVTDSTTFTTTLAIPTDTPSSGVLRVVDDSTKTEQRYSYTSYSGLVFSGIVKLFGSLDAGLDRDYNGDDTAYVPFLDEEATSTTVSTSVQYYADRFVLAVVRKKGIVPFKIKGKLDNTGYTTTAIRTEDTIVE